MMSEVKRYGHLSYLVEATPQILQLYPAMTVYVLAADFDRVTAERDALQLRLNAADQRIDDIERALGGMLFAFDDGVGRDWSADLLDYARKLTSAAEFNHTESRAGARNHGIPGTSGMRLNMLANQGE